MEKFINMTTKITQALMERIFRGSWHDEIVLTGKSLEIMLEINKTLSRLAPIDEDGTRYFWFEVPRGHHWYFLSTGCYKDYTYIKIGDRDMNVCIMSNKNRGNGHNYDMEWFLCIFNDFVKEMVDSICLDVESYNKNVEKFLPYRQRKGSIKRSDFNRILPQYKATVDDMERAVKVLNELICRSKHYGKAGEQESETNYPEPFDDMSIRRFCKYYRIADEKFRHEIHDNRVDDVEYYARRKFDRLDGYNLDDVEDFKKFATDHYGELGLSRMDVHATDYYVKGRWVITFGISYSAYVLDGIEIAMALYDSGAPFILHDAERLLAILEERDNVLLTPFAFHDYLCHHKEGSAYTLPYKENCGKEDEITKGQYDEIVKLAEWEAEIPVGINVETC